MRARWLLLVVAVSPLAGAAAATGCGSAYATSDTSDAAIADTDGSSSSCDASFCDDFDDGPFGARWTKAVISDGGVLDLDASESRSPPHALHAYTALEDAAAPSSSLNAYLEKNLGRGTHLRCDFDVLVQQRTGQVNWIELLRVSTGGPGVVVDTLWLSLTGDHAGFREDKVLAAGDGGCECPTIATQLTFALPPARWTRVTFDTDFHTLTIRYDGNPIASGPAGGFDANTDVIVDVGAIFQRGGGEILVDDVACTLE